MIRTLFAGVALAAMPLTPALASDDLPSKTVSYADLNLANNAGVTTLKQRLARAARDVCGDPDIRDLRQVMIAKKCRKSAMLDVTRAVDFAIAAQKSQQLARAERGEPRL